MTTKFEEIIGNPGIFKIILDKFFHDWPGHYDVMPAENPSERLFPNDVSMAKFCQKIRSNNEGFERCMNCDIEFADNAKKVGKPIYYTCHAGLMDIAVPIIVGDDLIATILCGQCRSLDPDLENKAIEKTKQTESELGFENGELLDLRSETPVLSNKLIEDVKGNLWEVATYVSNLGLRKLEAEKAKRDLAYRLEETESIQKILLELSGELYNIETFWRKLNDALVMICQIVGASYSIFATCEKSTGDQEMIGVIRSSSNLPDTVLADRSLKCNLHIAQSIQEMQPLIIELKKEDVLSELLDRLREIVPETSPLEKIAIIPVRLDPERLGAIVLFISKQKDINKSLELRDELSLLTQAANNIATVYGNCVLYERQQELTVIQGEWLENVSHQILAPINGILGQTENLSRKYKAWQKTSPQRIDNSLVTLAELGDWANRMARNFAWVANAKNHPRELSLRLEEDLPGKLIGYARNVQGFAKARGVFMVHVESESIEQLNYRIVIDNKLFKQAVINLLDNAVKYANSNTRVVIDSKVSPTHGYINITDLGIRLLEVDVEKVFDRYYRTEAAKRRYVIGSGIGLGIARDIIRLHGGDLVANPSVQAAGGWKTTFVISLPLK